MKTAACLLFASLMVAGCRYNPSEPDPNLPAPELNFPSIRLELLNLYVTDSTFTVMDTVRGDTTGGVRSSNYSYYFEATAVSDSSYKRVGDTAFVRYSYSTPFWETRWIDARWVSSNVARVIPDIQFNLRGEGGDFVWLLDSAWIRLKDLPYTIENDTLHVDLDKTESHFALREFEHFAYLGGRGGRYERLIRFETTDSTRFRLWLSRRPN